MFISGVANDLQNKNIEMKNNKRKENIFGGSGL
jgi:hypothetical protein